jgi:hypothetical protein
MTYVSHSNYIIDVAKDGDASATTRLQAAGDAVGDKFDQTKHETKADVHKEAAKH